MFLYAPETFLKVAFNYLLHFTILYCLDDPFSFTNTYRDISLAMPILLNSMIYTNMVKSFCSARDLG